MAVNAVGVINGYQNPTGVVARDPNKSLGQQDFLKLIIAELANQDPMKAQDSAKMLENFMNIANYQASQATTSTLDALKKQENQMYAANLVGKNVQVRRDGGEPTTGTITKVGANAEGIYVFTVNGSDYTADEIVSINHVQPTQTASE
jgi:flagellar basal-body rod modification protein FlgD